MARKAPSSTFSATPRPSAEQAQKAPPHRLSRPSRRAHGSGSRRPRAARGAAPGAPASPRPPASRRRGAAAGRTRERTARAGGRTSGPRTRRSRSGCRRDRPPPRRRSRGAAPPAAGASRGDSRASRTRARGRRRGTPRACPSSCARSDDGDPGGDLEIQLRRGRGGEQRPDGGELVGESTVRGARDRDLAVIEVGPGPHERKRLDRLGRRAKERDELRVTRLPHDRGRRAPRPRGRRVHASTTSPRVTSTWIAPAIAGRLCPRCQSYRKSRPGCASSTRSSRTPDRARRTGPHRDREDLRSSARDARRPDGSRAPRGAARTSSSRPRTASSCFAST